MNYSTLPAPDGVTTINHKDAKSRDLISALIAAFPEAVKDTRQFSKQFEDRRGAAYTAYNVWSFLKTHFVYLKDDDLKQVIKLPRVAIRRRKNDCKSYSLTAAAILYNLGFKVKFRFAGYRKARKSPSHVYVIATAPDGQRFIVDGCYSKFNSEKKPILVQDSQIMEVHTLSDDTGAIERAGARYSNLKGEAAKNYKRLIVANMQREMLQPGILAEDLGATKAERKAKRKKGAKKFGKGLATVFLAPGRGAFLAYILMNINGVALKLDKLVKLKKIQPVLEKWKNLGGKEKPFLRAIAKGAKHKPLYISKKNRRKQEAKLKALRGVDLECYDCGDLGFTGVEIAGMVAAAVPVLAVIIPVIAKSFKGQPEERELAAEGGELLQTVQGQEINPAPLMVDGEGTEASEAEELEGINDDLGAPPVDWSKLIGGLNNVFQVGVTAIQTKIEKKKGKSPKFLEALKYAPDDLITGQYIRKTGVKRYIDDAATLKDKATSAAPFAIAAAAVAYLVAKK